MDLENPKKISNFFFGMTHKAVSTQGGQRESWLKRWSEISELTQEVVRATLIPTTIEK